MKNAGKLESVLNAGFGCSHDLKSPAFLVSICLKNYANNHRERVNNMSIEISLLLSAISVSSAIFFNAWNKNRNQKKDAGEEIKEERAEAKETAANTTAIMVKLEMMSSDIKEIKADNKDLRAEMNVFRERLVATESSLKSLHKRLNGE